MIAQVDKVNYELAPNDIRKSVYGGLTEPNKPSKKLYIDDSLDIIEKSLRSDAISALKNPQTITARALVEIADLHFRAESYGRAIDAYVKSLKINGENITVYEKLISSLLKQNKVEEADKYFQILLNIVDNQPNYVHDYLAFRIKVANEYPEMNRETNQIIEKYSRINDDRVQNIRGLYMLLRDNLLNAKKTFQAGLEINSENIDLNNNLGVYYKTINKLDKAVIYLKKAHSLNPKYAVAYENLASIYYLKGSIKDAISILEKAQKNKAPLSNIWNHNLASLYHENGDYELAISAYKSLIANEPTNSIILNNIGVSYFKLDNITESIKFFNDSIELTKENVANNLPMDGRFATAFNNLTGYYLDHNNNKMALSLINFVQKHFPLNNIAYNQEGLVKLSQNKFMEAKKLFKKSLNMNPNYLESLANYTFILEDIEFDFEAAIKAVEGFEPSVTNQEVNDVLNNNLVFAYLKSGKIDLAKKNLDKIGDLYASSATRGLYYLLVDDLDKSEKNYRDAFKKTSGFRLKMAKQFYNYEFMEYWIRKGDVPLAISFALEGVKYNANTRIHEQMKRFILSVQA